MSSSVAPATENDCREILEWPLPEETTFLWRLASTAAVLTTAVIIKPLMGWLNTVKVYNKHVLLEALEKRPPHVPLITVSNHQSCLDDPGLWGILNMKHLWNHRVMRWSLAAHDICFTNAVHSQFFAFGKCVPIVRGLGVYQRAMDFCIEELNKGCWVHIFPEGRVNVEKQFIRLKWGVGRLIADASTLPIVLPMWHLGMDEVLPNIPPYIPRVGKKVTLNVGQPLDFGSTLAKLRAKDAGPVEMRKVITDRIQDELEMLRKETEMMHYGKSQ